MKICVKSAILLVFLAVRLLVFPAVPLQAEDVQRLPAQPRRSASMNYSVDLCGPEDKRPDTWGHAAAITKLIPFHPPAGYRTHILRVYGDFVAQPNGKAPDGKWAGVLLALSSTRADADEFVDYGADNTFLYVQNLTTSTRLAFDTDVSVGGLLDQDNVLAVKMADWLNNTGLTIHMECTFVVVYVFEKERL